MKIRIGTFETNSSSTHSICIPEDASIDKLKCPSEFIFKDQYEFGWEIDSYNDFWSKFNYLMLIFLDPYLEEAGIKKYENPDPNKWPDIIDQIHLTKENTKGTIFEFLYNLLSDVSGDDLITFNFDVEFFDGYVDHESEYADSFEYIMKDYDLLKKFLFSSQSCVNTDNDNY